MHPAGVVLLMIGSIALVMLGCGSGPESGEPGRGSLRVGTPMHVRQANPLVDYGYNIFAMLATHDTLVRFDGAMHPLPQLARTWNASADCRRWQFVLRTDARWHDGRPVTAGDVRFTFDYLAEHHPASAWMASLIDRISVDGDRVAFYLRRPYSRFLLNCGFIVRILPRHVWQTVTDPFRPGTAATTVGCGPFVFEGFDGRAGRLDFSRNADYYGPAPSVPGLTVFLGRTFDELALALAAGDLDLFYKYASGFSPAHLSGLANSTDLYLPVADALGIPAALGFNLGRAPLGDVAVRRAIAAAIDYPHIAASLMGANGSVPDTGFLPPALGKMPALPALLPAPDVACRLLAAAGYSDADGDGIRNGPAGENLTLTLLARADLPGTDALLPILAHNLKQVGIALTVRRADLSTWIEQVHEGRYDLVLFRTTPWGMVMDAGYASGYFDARRQGGGTLANVADPVFHALCDRLLATTDPDRQAEIGRRIRAYYAENLPALALCWAVNTYPMRRAYKGATINQIEGGLLNRQSLAALAPAGETGDPQGKENGPWKARAAN